MHNRKLASRSRDLPVVEKSSCFVWSRIAAPPLSRNPLLKSFGMCELRSGHHSLKTVPRACSGIAKASDTCDGPARPAEAEGCATVGSEKSRRVGATPFFLIAGVHS